MERVECGRSRNQAADSHGNSDPQVGKMLADPEILTRRTKGHQQNGCAGITNVPNHRGFLRSVEVAVTKSLNADPGIVFFDPTCKGFGDSGTGAEQVKSQF